MADLEIPVTCPECGAGMTAAQCYSCGFDVSAVELGADDSPATDRHAAAQVPPARPSLPPPGLAAPRRTSGPHPISQAPVRGGGFAFLVILCILEVALSATALAAIYRPEVLAALGPALALPLERLSPIGGGDSLAIFAGASIPFALFLLLRKRWAWAISVLICVGWMAIGFFLARGEEPARLAAHVAPGALGFLLVLLGVRAPGARPVPHRTTSNPHLPRAPSPRPR